MIAKRFLSLFIILLSSAHIFADYDGVFVPEDLSYDFAFSCKDLNLKGRVKSIDQSSAFSSAPGLRIGNGEYWKCCFYLDVYEDRDYTDIETAAYGTPNYRYITHLPFYIEFLQDGRVDKYGDNEEDLQYWFSYQYDDNKRVKSVKRNGTYGFDKEYIYTYTNNLIVAKDIKAGYQYKHILPSTYKYDDEGRVSEVVTQLLNSKGKVIDTYVRTYEYKTEGEIFNVFCDRVINPKKEHYETYWSYDSKGRLVEYLIVHDHKKNGKEEYSSKFEYDDNNRIKKEYIEYPEGRYENDYSYDQQGNVSEIQSNRIYKSALDPRVRKVLTIYTYQYDYDTHGNWTKMKIFENSVFKSETTRIITYWE